MSILTGGQMRFKKSVIRNIWRLNTELLLLNDLLMNLYTFAVSRHHECIQIIFWDSFRINT